MQTVAVITPTLNAARWLQACCESVHVNQREYGAVHHILIDDGSTDGTLETAQGWGCSVLDGPRRGLYAAMNAAIDATAADIIVVLGADDLLLPGAVAAAVRALADTGAGWAIGGLEWIDATGQSLGTIAAPPKWLSARQLAALGWGWTHHQSTYMTRALWERVRPYDETLRSAADFDLMVRALQVERFARVPRTLACFRRHGANTSTSGFAVEGESASVRARYMTPGTLSARFTTASMKVYVNARNPHWAATKLRSSA